MSKRKNAGKNIIPAESGLPDVPENDLKSLLSEESVGVNASRRDFLKVFGFSIASAAVMAACKRPIREAIPYAIQPPELIPRKPMYYASTFFDGQEYCSIVVKTIDGRPIKVEGNSLSPFNREGTTARVQASVLSLYDDSRLKFPAKNGQQTDWETADSEIIGKLKEINSGGGEIVLLTSNIVSPSTRSLISNFGSSFSKFRWVKYSPVSYSAIISANEASFGLPVFPDYHFENAAMVVSVNCDFLGTWGAPVHFIPGYASRKRPDGKKGMLYHVQFESGMTLTGGNADRRIKIKPSEEKSLIINLYNRIAEKKGGLKIDSPPFREDLSGIADMLISASGKSIVMSGTNDPEIQTVVNGINYLLNNYTDCIDLNNPLNIASGPDSEMEKLVADMNDGKIGALLMHGVNPVYDYPDPANFLTGLSKTSLSVNMTDKLNETVGKASYECPVNHFLESWNDAEIVKGMLSLAQPAIDRFFDTRSFQDSLLKWSGINMSWHDYLVQAWEKEYFPGSGAASFKDFWNRSLRDGVHNYKAPAGKPASFNSAALVSIRPIDDPASSGKGFEITITESVSLGTGKHSNNPWLMELPDPVTRVCWENVASISPVDAARMGISTGQLLKIGEISLPALIQPGQAEGTVSTTLGYGHTGSGPVADNNGVNLYPLARYENGYRRFAYIVPELVSTPEVVKLGLMQMNSSMEGRPIVRETTLSRYLEDPTSGNELHFEFETMHKSLYPDKQFEAFHWAMAIDLNACVGCGACVIACQAENNSPTVGKVEVSKNRIMQWIKVHRYYSEDQDDPKVYFQPVFCQHCDDAPCENVCPVSATNHSSEGLNQMAYNRCVGTKYCMNNCPYRVRRFNWFRYTNNKVFDYNSASDLGKMVLNPDVTVRERGVVEKCSFCVQRIQAGKLEAKLERRTLKDLEIKPACMQACPAGAIVFGNLNDPESNISKSYKDSRRYALLEELHTLPSIGFLTRVRNDGKLSV